MRREERPRRQNEPRRGGTRGVPSDPRSPRRSPPEPILTRVSWWSNQPIYGTTEPRGTAAQADHRRAPQRDRRARARARVGTAHRAGRGRAGRSDPPLLRVEGSAPDRHHRRGRRRAAHPAQGRARHPRRGARARPRARLPVSRGADGAQAQRAFRRDRPRGAASPATATSHRRSQRGGRVRAGRAVRSAPRSPRPRRGEPRARARHLVSIRRRRRPFIVRRRRNRATPAAPHRGAADRPLSRSERWKD